MFIHNSCNADSLFRHDSIMTGTERAKCKCTFLGLRSEIQGKHAWLLKAWVFLLVKRNLFFGKFVFEGLEGLRSRSSTKKARKKIPGWINLSLKKKMLTISYRDDEHPRTKNLMKSALSVARSFCFNSKRGRLGTQLYFCD